MSIPDTNDVTVAKIAAAMEIANKVAPMALDRSNDPQEILRRLLDNFEEAYKRIGEATK